MAQANNKKNKSIIKEVKNVLADCSILNDSKKCNIALAVSLIAGAAAFCLWFKSSVSEQILNLQQQQERAAKQIELLSEVQPVYVFNLEKVVAASDLVNIQKDFEEQVKKLGAEVDKAKKKISNLKKSKVNEDFSDVYLKSLTLKRDELIEKHEKEIMTVTDNINKALAEIATEKNAPAVFNYRSLALTTKYVIDVSDEVIAKVKQTSQDSQ